MAQRTPVPQSVRTSSAATEKQVAFMRRLIDERDLLKSPKWFDSVNAMDAEEYAVHLERVKEGVGTYTKKQASTAIEALLALPKKEVERGGGKEEVVPDGHYALKYPEDQLNPIRFYRVNHGKKGTRWENHVFVDRFASDERYPVKGDERTRVLAEIAGDPFGAAQRYGLEMGRCSCCNRKLTRELSRALGIGPICGNRHGWLTDNYVAAARARIVKAGGDPEAEVTA